jgi:hypothetical protein
LSVVHRKSVVTLGDDTHLALISANALDRSNFLASHPMTGLVVGEALLLSDFAHRWSAL